MFETINKNNENVVPLRLGYVEKRDIANLEFLGKSAAHPK